MKLIKRFFAIISLLIIIMCSFSCKKEEKTLKVLMVDASDNFSFADTFDNNPLKLEQKEKYFVKKNIKTDSIFGYIDAVYDKSIKSNYQYFYCDRYKSVLNPFCNVYFDEDGRIVRYDNLMLAADETAKLLTENELIAIADSIVRSYVDISDYQKDFSESNLSKKSYDVKYTKYIDSLVTADYAHVLLDQYGNVLQFGSSFLGEIDKNAKFNFNLEEIKEEINKRADTMLKNVKERSNTIEYEKYNFVLIMTSKDTYGLVCDLYVKIINNLDNGYQKVMESMIRFLIC